MTNRIKIEFLQDHRRLIPTVEKYFQSIWNEYYGPQGTAAARNDIELLCNKTKIPIGLIALKNKRFVGFTALRPKSASHTNLTPWVTSLFVVPDERRQGIAIKLIQTVEELALKLGYSEIFARSATAVDLFRINKWRAFDRLEDGNLMVFRKKIIC